MLKYLLCWCKDVVVDLIGAHICSIIHFSIDHVLAVFQLFDELKSFKTFTTFCCW